MAALIIGFVAYGTGSSPGSFVELSGGSYARTAVTYTGSGAGGSLTSTAGVAPTSTGSYNAFAIFDASTGGNMILFSSMTLTPFTSGATIPALALTVALEDGIYQNLASSAGGLVFTPGQYIGTVNGNPLLIGNTDVEVSGVGTLIAGGGTLLIPMIDQPPVDAPGLQPGFAGLRVDTTNNKLWVYNGATWKGVTIS